MSESEPALQPQASEDELEWRGVEDFWYQVPRHQRPAPRILAHRAADGAVFHLHQFETAEDVVRFLHEWRENGMHANDIVVISRVTQHPASKPDGGSPSRGQELPIADDPESRPSAAVNGELHRRVPGSASSAGGPLDNGLVLATRDSEMASLCPSNLD